MGLGARPNGLPFETISMITHGKQLVLLLIGWITKLIGEFGAEPRGQTFAAVYLSIHHNCHHQLLS